MSEKKKIRMLNLMRIVLGSESEERKFYVFSSMKGCFNELDIVQIIKEAVKEIGEFCMKYAAPTLKSLSVTADYLKKEFSEIGVSNDVLAKALATA